MARSCKWRGGQGVHAGSRALRDRVPRYRETDHVENSYAQDTMAVVVSMLRGVNLGPHNRIKMEDLRGLCGTLKLRDAQTYVQSGNVIFGTDERDLQRVSKRLEDAIEKKFKFRCDVISRTSAELQAVVAKNPF